MIHWTFPRVGEGGGRGGVCEFLIDLNGSLLVSYLMNSFVGGLQVSTMASRGDGLWEMTTSLTRIGEKTTITMPFNNWYRVMHMSMARPRPNRGNASGNRGEWNGLFASG